MRAQSIALVCVLSVAVAAIAGTNAAAQQQPPASKTTTAAKAVIARTAWGDPDLQGVWTNATPTPLERPDEVKGKQALSEEEVRKAQEQIRKQSRGEVALFVFQGDTGAGPEHWYERGTTLNRTALIIDPPDGKIPPLTPWGQERADSRRGQASKGTGEIWGPEDLNPWDRCITRGIPGAMIPTVYNNGYRIMQIPGYVVIVYEMIHDARFVPVDGRPHLPSRIRQWMGDSRGHWEGNTLVIETTNYTGNTTIEFAGKYHSEDLKVVERFTRTSANSMDYQFTANDLKTWTKPWTVSIPMTKDDRYRIYEYACHEGNYAMPHRLSGSRAEEKAAAQTK
jgi:hypothetical protein